MMTETTSGDMVSGPSSGNNQKAVRLMTYTGWLIGLALTMSSSLLPPLRDAGWQSLGPIIGIMFVVFSLFGDLPSWLSWTQKFGSWVFGGIVIGTLILLIPFLVPRSASESSFLAFSPTVWAAYFSIVAVGLSFEASPLPSNIYYFCQSLVIAPSILIPSYVFVVGLLGNIFDGVSIIAISVVIFLSLLPKEWAIRSSFALLFGGLISNLITVAAEPTNIKFQDVLQPLLDRVKPAFWATNWPISVFGILLPAIGLAIWMRNAHAVWRSDEPAAQEVGGEIIEIARDTVKRVPASVSNKRSRQKRSEYKPIQSLQRTLGNTTTLSLIAIAFLAIGIIIHSIYQLRASSSSSKEEIALWLYLLPAGVAAILHLATVKRVPERLHPQTEQSGIQFAWQHVRNEWAVWGKLMIIFSLLWFLSNALVTGKNVFSAFFTWPEPIRYSLQVVLSLLSSVTDNVALAAMQGSLITQHALTTWQIRLLFLLLTWSGGLTSFGCLQSLALTEVRAKG